MAALFRGLMVPISFILYLALHGAVTVAVIALGPILRDGVKPEELQTLLPKDGAMPGPYVIAAGVGLAATLFMGMFAMLRAERVTTIGGFFGRSLLAAFWFSVIFAGGFAAYLSGQPGEGLPKFIPALLLAGGLFAGSAVCAIILGLPFLWWVSERKPAPRPVRRPAPPAPPPPVVEEPLPVEPPVTAIAAAASSGEPQSMPAVPQPSQPAPTA